MNTTVIIEALDLSEAVIDAAARTVRQRIITSGKSKNNRRYGEAVLQLSAPLFENVQTYANHPSKSDKVERPERNVREITGWITNVEYKEGALWGVRHFTRTQAGNDVWTLVEDIVSGKAPASLLGGSINALGKAKLIKEADDQVLEVESIDRVVSVDDVTVPAAGGGFERLMAGMTGDLTSELLGLVEYTEWLEARPEFVDRLKREYKAVRLEEETKLKLADADQKVKAAESKLEEVKAERDALKADIATITGERDAARLEADGKARLLVIEQALNASGLPATWRESIRKQLVEAKTEQWQMIIETERKKANSTGARVPVSGAGQQVSSPAPRVLSDPLAEARQKIASARTPEELQRIRESLGR